MPLTDEQLRRTLAATPVDVDVDTDLGAVRARAGRRRRQHRAVAVACVVFAIGLAGTGISLLTSSGTEQRPRSVVAEPVPTQPVPTSTRLSPDVTTIPPSAMDGFPVPDGAGATLALGDGSVWVGGYLDDTGPCRLDCGRITRLDASSGAVEATITVPKYPRALAYGFDALWAEVEVPDNSPGLVVKIDPATSQVVAQAEIPDIVVAGSTGHPKLAVGAGAVWSLYGDRLTKFDPQTGAVVGNVRLGGSFDGGIVANDAGVWLVGVQILAIDPTSMETRQIATVDAGYIQSSTIDGDTIWLTEAHGGGGRDPVIELVRIDTLSGGTTFTGIPTTNVAAGSGRVWFQGFAGAMLSDSHPDDVVELDPATTRPIRAATVGYGALAHPVMAVDRDQVWLLSGGGLVRIRA